MSGNTDSELDTPRLRLIMAGLFVVVAIGGATDLYLDAPSHWFTPHVLFEVLLMALSLSAAAYLAHGWWKTSTALNVAQSSLHLRVAERDHWQRSAERALEGLGAAIDLQFEKWHLTPTEREVALLLLKGHGHKQIAARSGRSERTVRQHAVAVYQKSGLGGRAELAAFFLDGVMLPVIADQS